ncbi:hypothetical protein J6E39_08520 [bacterium]|nr:hypothetical protein [bacterium]
MKLLEVKNNLVKIEFEDANNLVLSGFVVITDSTTPYVAQIMSLKSDETGNFAIAKLLFTFDNEGIVKNYNGSVPSLSSEISVLNPKELIDILPVNIPIKLGQLAQQPFDIEVDKEIFGHNLLVCSNNQYNTNVLLSNITRQFEIKGIKSVILDLDGKYNYENKIKFPSDFKIPLNYAAINYIYENDLNDIDPTSKAIIQDIFLELQEYVKTLEDGFIPFDAFINVVDAQYRETKMSQLILLKNKLLKYKENNVFAQDQKEADSFKQIAECGRNIVIDLSDISSENLQMHIINYIYKTFNSLEIPVYSFVALDNSYANKHYLKLLTTKNCVSTTIIIGHDFKYIKELKSISNNMILFAPITIEHDFASYNTFLNKLNPDEFIIVGDLTQYIPFIVQLETLEIAEESEDEDVSVQDTEKEVDEVSEFDEESSSLEEEMNTPDSLVPDEQLERELNSSNIELNIDTPQDITEPEDTNIEPDFSQDMAEPEITINEDEVIEINEDDDAASSIEFEQDDTNTISGDDVEFVIQEEPVEDNSEIADNFEEPEITDFNEIDNELDIQEPIIEEEAAPEETEIISEPELEINEENLGLDDNVLDFIGENIPPEEENSDEDLIVEDNDNQQVIPVYQAEELSQSSAVTFNAGDHVSHPKYGEGVVEKMVNYGTKKLCSIMFTGNRRRLLDPAISEITKI